MAVYLKKPANVDLKDPSVNGGAITDSTIYGSTIGELIPNIRSYEAEFGAERWIKFFVKVDSDIVDAIVTLSHTPLLNGETILLAEANGDEVEADIDKSTRRKYGITTVLTWDQATLTFKVQGDSTEFIKTGDIVNFLSVADATRAFGANVQSVNYDSANDETSVEIDSAPENSDLTSVFAATCPPVFDLNADQYKGFWIIQKIKPHTIADQASGVCSITVFYDIP